MQIVGKRINKESFFPFLAQREEGRLNNEVRRINNEIKDLTEKRNILEVHVHDCMKDPSAFASNIFPYS